MKKKKFVALALVVATVMASMQISTATVNKPSPRKAGDTVDMSSQVYSTSLKGVRDDSWVKEVTYTGYGVGEIDPTQYCTVTIGFKDGVFSNTDYMWTGRRLTKKCDVATFIYVKGCVENSNGSTSGWSSWVTNSQTADKKQVSHTGDATYYVAFNG